LELVKKNAFRLESAELRDTRVQVYGDAALVTGLFLSNINSERWPYGVQRNASTWIRRHGTWQCVAWQTMVVTTSAKS
jgi:hypothetical protein